ncbi:MAG: hypothetical protein HY248_04355 [Fimbriimonas ginsengisoli]|nr:hypothetical protein [Fimbriimonas ginsengisoli]
MFAQATALGQSGRLTPNEWARVPAVVQTALSAGAIRYAGTRWVEFRGPRRANGHSEWVLHEGDRTRVEFPTDASLRGQVIVDADGERRHYFPKRNLIEVSPSREDFPRARLIAMVRRGLRQAGGIRTEDGGLVAGRPTSLVTLKELQGIVRAKLWIDPDNGMALKRALFDRTGAVVASLEYRAINYGPAIKPDSFRLERPGSRVANTVQQGTQRARLAGFQPLKLPPGSPYRQQSARLVRVGGGQAFSQMFAGPWGQFSLFHLKKDVNLNRLRLAAGGRVHVTTFSRNGQSYAVVGDMDESELREVARQFTER